MRCEAYQGELRLYRNGAVTPLLTWPDATYASGRAGFGLYVETGGNLADNELDDFEAGWVHGGVRLRRLP